MADTPRCRQYSASSPSPTGSTTMPLSDARVSRAISSRSASVNRYFLAGLVETATMTSSNRLAARAITSRWPLWMGSEDPGQTARLMLRTYPMERPGYHDWMHPPREVSTPLAPAPWQRTALGANLLGADGGLGV